MRLFIILLILICLNASFVFADFDQSKGIEIYEDSLSFSLSDAAILSGSPANGTIGTLNLESLDDYSSDTLAITVELTNQGDNKKYDLTSEFEFRLVDEFNNKYRRLVKPAYYKASTYFPNKHFPSLYPNERFTQTIFFEPPVSKSQKLTLYLRNEQLQMNKEFPLLIPTIAIRNFAKKDQFASDLERDFHVIVPKENSAIAADQTILIQLGLKDDAVKPDIVYVVAPNYLLEDPSAAMYYDLRIPASQSPGPYTVVVIAKWSLGVPNGEILSSKSVTVNVVEPN